MKKRVLVALLATALTVSMMTGCGSKKTEDTSSTKTEETSEDSDQEAADKVAKLIDDIYVQERTDKTDEQCKAAKEAWDKLTDAQKELVEGENADPDYFGRDTGDASKDDPLNEDNIGENEILVVSFGTSFNDSRAEDVKGIEDALAEAVKTAGFDSLDAAKEEGTAFVFMGHGTSHTAKISYSQMQTQMEQLGYENVFIGTVEGEPEDTACEAVIEKLKNAGYKKVILRPLMVVAGDHANNDMAGDDDDSWKSQFEASGVFDSIDTQIAGLGEIDAIQQLYVAHTQAAIDAE